MQLRILGCSGGIAESLRTTTMLLNDEVLIDAGTGVGDLSLASMSLVQHIFLTHSHMDHITSIPLLLDSVFDQIESPVVIHGLVETIQALKDHVFNNIIWPDFSVLPSKHNPVMCYEVMAPGDIFAFDDYSIEMIPVNHIVPGVGYRVQTLEKAFAFSGDTTTNDRFWATLNQRERLDILIVEAAFPDQDIDISRRAGHYCPRLLAEDLAKLKHRPEIYITHPKPGAEQAIFEQCKKHIQGHRINLLSAGSLFTL
ncbi:CAMP phosphodiesterases class-II:Metallo-beta-lactamase superfamily [hydrothermal vent metagenome]|uniref:cAMP phosphodiesterases class-II:Metallo-beta-lactamase superfamily n=1 Tax=hydrothermal vent metagenome TaxID=652676 RepID=A0A3B1B6X9_9ZZZZ